MLKYRYYPELSTQIMKFHTALWKWLDSSTFTQSVLQTKT